MDNKQSPTIINDFFADLTKDYPRINEEWIELQCSDSLPYVNVEHVQKQLMKINVNKVPGPNDPVLKILKDFAYVLAFPLTEIFNDSFREKYFPKMWKQAMDTPNRIIRIVFLDFKKAFDLIDHNVLLKDMKFVCVRMPLIKWFTTYLNERSHYTELGNDTSDLRVIGGGVPQGSKIGPIATKINSLPAVIREEMSQIMATNSEACAVVDDDIIMFMDDSTLYEVLDVSTHTSGKPIGGLLGKINRIVKFTS